MSEPSSEAQALPLELARDVEHRCNRFEVAWQGGTPPRLEDTSQRPRKRFVPRCYAS